MLLHTHLNILQSDPEDKKTWLMLYIGILPWFRYKLFNIVAEICLQKWQKENEYIILKPLSSLALVGISSSVSCYKKILSPQPQTL